MDAIPVIAFILNLKGIFIASEYKQPVQQQFVEK